MPGQSQINQPDIDGIIVGGFTTVDNTPQKILIVGQDTTGNTVDTLIQNIQNDPVEVNALFGARSMIAGMIRNVRKINTETQIDVIPVTASGNPAIADITFTGTLDLDTTYTFVIGSSQDFTIPITVPANQSATQTTLTIVNFLLTVLELPVVASVNASTTVRLTVQHDGLFGNSMGLSVSGSDTTQTFEMTAFGSGTAAPTFTNTFNDVGGIRYQNIVWPYTDVAVGIPAVADFLEPRFNNAGKILDGRASMSITNTVTNFLDTVTGLITLNDKNLLIIADEKISEDLYQAPSQFEIPYAKAAQNCAIRSLRLTEGANIASLVIANIGSLDRFGGIAIASLPYFNTPLKNLPLISPEHGFTEEEIEDLFDAGFTIWGNNLTNTDAIMGEAVTTFKTDAAGNPTDTFKLANYDDTGRECREFYFNNYKARYNQHRLTTGDIEPQRAMANADSIRRFSNRLYSELADDVLVVKGLITSGEGAGLQAQAFYDKNLVVTIKSATTVSVTMKLKIVTQLRALQFTIEVVID